MCQRLCHDRSPGLPTLTVTARYIEGRLTGRLQRQCGVGTGRVEIMVGWDDLILDPVRLQETTWRKTPGPSPLAGHLKGRTCLPDRADRDLRRPAHKGGWLRNRHHARTRVRRGRCEPGGPQTATGTRGPTHFTPSLPLRFVRASSTVSGTSESPAALRKDAKS